MSTLMESIRRATGRKMEAEDGDEEKTVDAAEEENEQEAADPSGDDDQSDDDDPDGDDGDGDEETAAAEEDEDEKQMSAQERSAFTRGRKVERNRLAAILGSRQAEANPGLAAHLAFRTADSPKKALAALKAGKPATSALSSRMNGRGGSRTGRGGEAGADRRADGASWDRAMSKAGVKTRG